MHNPFLNKQMNTGKKAEDHGLIEPVPESYVGDNNPYRGIENHGVAPTHHPSDPSMEWDNGTAKHPQVFVEEAPEPDPIPVRIIAEQGARTELRSFRVQLPQDGTPVRLLGEMPERKMAIIRVGPNTGPDMAIASDPSQLSNYGWNAYIYANYDSPLTITTQGDVWACTAKLAGSTVTSALDVHILVEYWVKQ